MRLPFFRKYRFPPVLPAHLAVIMDGNGRWAANRGLPRSAGHKAGFDNFVRTVELCAGAGIGFLTVYAFSTENWNRSDDEVRALLRIMNEAITEYVPTLRERNIRLRILGDLSRFDSESRAGLESSVEALSGSTGMTLSVALSYGGRVEIVAAARQAAAEGDITAETLSAHLYTAGLPDPDLIIRTSGELRISNFLLWQSAYSEYYFTSTLWPDFGRKELCRALWDYSTRKRRFGRA